jgi:hypothetical protein
VYYLKVKKNAILVLAKLPYFNKQENIEQNPLSLEAGGNASQKAVMCGITTHERYTLHHGV